MTRRLRQAFAADTGDPRPVSPLRSAWVRLGVALLTLAGAVSVAGAVGDETNRRTTAAPAVDLAEARLAAFRGEAGIVMYAGGCTVICGESTVPTSVAPAGAIDLISAKFGIVSPGTSTFGAGKARFEQVTLVKPLDTATPALLRRLATGTAIPQVTISFYPRATTTPQTFLKYTLTNPFVVSYEIEDDPEHAERFSLVFAQAKVEYFPAATGTKAPLPQPFCWDTELNSECR